MRQVFVALEKKHAHGFTCALFVSKACAYRKMFIVEHDGHWYFDLPYTRAVRACWAGYSYGKKFGYMMGGPWPTQAKKLHPLTKKKQNEEHRSK